MILSPLRRWTSFAALALAACGDAVPDSNSPSGPKVIEPGPAPGPQSGLDDAAIAAFEARPATERDFVIKFGEPFIGFETRGDAVLVSDYTAGQRFAYISQVTREKAQGALVLTVPMESAWEGDSRGGWRIAIEETACDDEFSGEITDHTAWAEPTVQDAIRVVRLRGCARIVGTPQRWPDNATP